MDPETRDITTPDVDTHDDNSLLGVSRVAFRSSRHNELDRIMQGLTSFGESGPLDQIVVSRASVLNQPDVAAAIRVIADGVSRAPIKVQTYRVPEKAWADAETHWLWEVLHDLPNPETASIELVHLLIRDLVGYGACFAQVLRNSRGEVDSLWHLPADQMTVTRVGGRKTWTLAREGQAPLVWQFDADKPPIWEMTRPSPLDHLDNPIWKLALAVDLYAQAFFGNSARPSGVFSSPATKWTDEQIVQIRKQIGALYGGIRNAHQFAVLGHDFKFNPISLPNSSDAQLLEVRAFLRTSIAALMGVPVHLLGDQAQASYSSLEHSSREFVGFCEVYFRLLESTSRRDLLSAKAYRNTRVLVDRESLIAVDLASKMQALNVAVNGGLMSPNEARARLGMDPTADGKGDIRIVNGNMITVEQVFTRPTPPVANTAPPVT